ncbi:uncharacterized protein LAESUDRAFT_286505 [Laetiporus sulphureus 93-53]|uniref:Metallo-beta-lactamase domain-containing protein n=1 Tax=Laetiporus sulphureus 93-53 TaxID=1314785 RepID=A0A165DCQ6_9APHY|nr:uncharacterized protein LAESUDRAFT_286505 [Laetiporus sulphureus 93-53]KZT04572.1 hypothetical protein LAESUDRAFT_286505 [Laetiporus sulphureus 93-53]
MLRHSCNGDTFIFDLGIRRDWEEALPPVLTDKVRRSAKVVVPQNVTQSLQKGRYDRSQVKHICLSHIHLDHLCNPASFANATFIVGENTRDLLTPGHPADPEAEFRSDLLPTARTRYISPTTEDMRPIGPFSRTLDVYGDGSLYIVDTPGQLPGHSSLGVLARTSADGGWIFLAGDAAGDWRLLVGETGIADHEHLGCVHTDKNIAAATIEQVKVLMKMPRVRVLIVHDVPWYEDNKDGPAFLPGSIESL